MSRYAVPWSTLVAGARVPLADQVEWQPWRSWSEPLPALVVDAVDAVDDD